MKVKCFPQCCGAGVLIELVLTGKGKEADFDLIKEWIAYARRNGYRMYDFPNEYEAQSGNKHHMDSKAVLNGPTDKKEWVRHNGWGMLVAMTSPGQAGVAQRLEEFGFQKLMETPNPVYSSASHKIILWGLDISKYTEEDLETSAQKKSKALVPTTKK
jgi:hypothetical protein